jgi:hypothetical protein
LLTELTDYLNGNINYIDPKYVRNMYNITKRLNGDKQNFFTLINKVVTKQLEGDANGVFRILDANQLKSSLTIIEMQSILDIVSNMKNVPNSKKAIFISEYRNILNKALNKQHILGINIRMHLGIKNLHLRGRTILLDKKTLNYL